MQFKDLIQKAKEVHQSYERYEKDVLGKSWSRENIAERLVEDVGDLMKLVMAK